MKISDITGIETGFEYLIIPQLFKYEELVKYSNRQKEKTAILTKNWTKELLIEWTLRNYLSLKMILSSTLLLNSASFASATNLRIVEPYLYYYSLINTSRALLFADPFVDWSNGGVYQNQS